MPFVKRMLLLPVFKNRTFRKIDVAVLFYLICIDGFLFEPFGKY